MSTEQGGAAQGGAAQGAAEQGGAAQAEGAARDAAMSDQNEPPTDAPASDQVPTTSSDWEVIQGELRTLRQELAEARGSLVEAQERADRYHSNWQRSAADFLNWKRRADQEKSEAGRLGEATVIADLLRVLDDFERAFGSLPSELRRLTWIEGVHMIWGKTVTIFESHGLSPIEAVGREFDPREHEAVMREDDTDPSEQTEVVQDLQRGYRFHDRILRPTLVKVGRPKAVASDAASGGSAPDDGNPSGDATAGVA